MSQLFKASYDVEINTTQATTQPGRYEARYIQPTRSVLEARSQYMYDTLVHYEEDTSPKIRNLRESRASLPILGYREELLHVIENNEVTVLVATTGSGEFVGLISLWQRD